MDNATTNTFEAEPGLPLVGGTAAAPHKSIETGSTYDVPHKFVMGRRTTLHNVAPVDRWVPASKRALAAGEPTSDGRQRLTVVSLCKPGNYPTRVFYHRTWIDPNGNETGGRKLKISTISAFKKLIEASA